MKKYLVLLVVLLATLLIALMFKGYSFYKSRKLTNNQIVAIGAMKTIAAAQTDYNT